MKLGNFVVAAPSFEQTRMTLFLWGPSGAGKTTLASTAPGKKLWILFDPDGAASLIGRDDILVLDLSGERHGIVSRFNDDDPFRLTAFLKEHPDIETIVFDSATAFAQLSLEHAVSEIKKRFPTTQVSLEDPAPKGYGHRNTLVLRAITSLMRLTKLHNLHYIIITHEDTATTDEKGNVLFITMALGGKIPNNVGLQLSEIWWMNSNDKGQRMIAVRPCRTRKPMKSRMFDQTGAPEFVWHYNANEWKGDGIKEWFEAWKERGGKKLSIPTK